MKGLFSIFEKYYPCSCKKQAAISSMALTIALANFCDQVEHYSQKSNTCVVKKKKTNRR